MSPSTISKTKAILAINASARTKTSITRGLVADICRHLQQNSDTILIERDLNQSLPFVSEEWIGANFTAEADHTAKQKQILGQSDQLISELERADIIIIGAPIYNFGVPASLKAWIDLICRVKKTFQYTDNGPQGLLTDKKAVLAMASGGTLVGSELDFVSGYLRHALGFIGITDVTIIAANTLEHKGESNAAQQARLQTEIQNLTL